MEPESSLPHSHVFATCPYPEPARSSPHPTPRFLQIHLNIILPFTPGSPKWCLSLSFPNQNSVYVSPLPRTLHMPRPSQYHTLHRYYIATAHTWWQTHHASSSSSGMLWVSQLGRYTAARNSECLLLFIQTAYVLKGTRQFNGCLVLQCEKSSSSCPLYVWQRHKNCTTFEAVSQRDPRVVAAHEYTWVDVPTWTRGSGVRVRGYDTNYEAFGELIREGQKGDFNSHIT